MALRRPPARVRVVRALQAAAERDDRHAELLAKRAQARVCLARRLCRLARRWNNDQRHVGAVAPGVIDGLRDQRRGEAPGVLIKRTAADIGLGMRWRDEA